MARSHIARNADHIALPRSLAVIAQMIEQRLLTSLWWLSGRLSPARASRLGGALLARVGPWTHKHRHVLANLQRVVPASDADAMAREVWRNLGQVIAEYPHLPELVAGRTELRIHADVAELIDADGACVFCTGHLGNWEVAAGAIASAGVALTVLHASQVQGIERMMTQMRSRLGCHYVDKRDGAPALVAALRRGDSVGVVVDQRVDGAAAIPFFGTDAATTTAPARLALRFGVPLVPVRIERLPDAHFRVSLEAPIPVPTHSSERSERARWMTTRFAARLERWVAAAPGHWLCTKRRWPKPPSVSRERLA